MTILLIILTAVIQGASKPWLFICTDHVGSTDYYASSEYWNFTLLPGRGFSLFSVVKPV